MITINEIISPDHDRLLKDYASILKSGVLTNNGPYVKEFEKALSQYCDNEALSICNGTLALHLSVRALGKTGEIITTPFSFIASSSSIIWESCTPVFCDINPQTLNIDPKEIEKKINPKTIAILGVHVFGNPCEIDDIEAIAEKHQLATIYDGAQAFGSQYKGRSVFTYGNFSTLSLHAFKIVSSIEGGAVFCKNAVELNEIFKIRYFGKNLSNEEVMLGTNAKMSEFNAAYGLLSLENIDQELKRRAEIAQLYIKHLGRNKNIQFQEITAHSQANHSYFPIILPSEILLEKILKQSKKEDIILKRYFYPSIPDIEFLNYQGAQTPISSDIAKRILCLPIHSGLTDSDVQKVCTTIAGAL